MFKVGDRVVVRGDSEFYEQRRYGKATVEDVLGPGGPWDVLVSYEGKISLYYNLCDLDKVSTFKGNIK